MPRSRKVVALLISGVTIVGVCVGYAQSGGPLWLALVVAAGFMAAGLLISRWVWREELLSRERVRKRVAERKHRSAGL